MGRAATNKKKLPRFVMFRPRPIDQRLVDFLREKSSRTNILPISFVIREALAFRAEALGLDIEKLVEEMREAEDHADSTPA